MTAEKFKRKLTAILSADVKGYSRLMGEDEETTVRTLQEYKEVMASSIQHHRGRIVGGAGDSLLAEFASVVDAVECGVEIQQVLRAKNALLSEDRRMDFRIGINLGDVIEEGDTIYGDGVNIAARLEGLAEPGGICISESAYQQIKNKLPLRYDDLGEHEVKNIAEPVRVYRAQVAPEAAPSKVIREKKPARKGLSKAALAVISVVVIAVAVILYQFVLRPSPSKTEVASRDKMAFPLPDVPSIAVLPFVNMSEDPKQEFLCDGMTEAIITALSKVPGMFVIARNSTFIYKGKPVKVKQVSEELGVRYVLEGSIQKSGDRLRITAQLIDALTGNHLWADSYDRDLKDIFAVQDEITLRILNGLRVRLTGVGVGSPAKYYKGKQSIDCFLKRMQASGYLNRRNSVDNNMARRMMEEVITLCPEDPYNYYTLGQVYRLDFLLGNTQPPRETLEKAMELVQKAIAMDDAVSAAHAELCMIYMFKREYDKGIAEGKKAVDLSPGGNGELVTYAVGLTYVGRYEEAIALYQKAMRLNPYAPTSFYMNYGVALRITGRFEEAVSAYKKAIQMAPDHLLAHLHLAATYSMMDRGKEAHAEAAEVLRINPKFSVDSYGKRLPYKDQLQIDKFVNALHEAGLK